ncbi:MAG: hypothetical protein KKF44_01965 [Nanoarchaeota archaeon]|nr:hypothetical protein [Nanoarchaeota archaeon]
MPQESPIRLIRTMKQQGFSNNEIIQNLNRQGYNNTQIFDAMNHIDTKNAVEGNPDNLIPNPANGSSDFSGSQNPVTPGFAGSDQTPMSPSNQAFGGGEESEDYQPKIENFDPKTEELIETIIDEKWEELLKDVNKIIEWKNRAEARLQTIETKFSSLKDNFDELHRAVIGKVSEYDQHILNVGTEIKAMEKVFSKVLPSFTENVHELARITEKAKKNQQQ